MPISIRELEAFHHFAVARISDGDAKLSLAELVDMWELEHPTDVERREINDALGRAAVELGAGKGRPASEFNAELRTQFGFANR